MPVIFRSSIERYRSRECTSNVHRLINGRQSSIFFDRSGTWLLQFMTTLRISVLCRCALQWSESFRMIGPVLPRLSVFALALTLILPLGVPGNPNVTGSHMIGTDCCGPNCPPPAPNSATGGKCCAFSRLPFSSSRITCQTNSAGAPLPIAAVQFSFLPHLGR